MGDPEFVHLDHSDISDDTPLDVSQAIRAEYVASSSRNELDGGRLGGVYHPTGSART